MKSISLPPLDALDEGDEVVVSFEDGSNAVLSSEVTMDWIGSGDMGASMNESLTLSVAFVRKSTGKYEVQLTSYPPSSPQVLLYSSNKILT